MIHRLHSEVSPNSWLLWRRIGRAVVAVWERYENASCVWCAYAYLSLGGRTLPCHQAETLLKFDCLHDLHGGVPPVPCSLLAGSFPRILPIPLHSAVASCVFTALLIGADGTGGTGGKGDSKIPHFQKIMVILVKFHRNTSCYVITQPPTRKFTQPPNYLPFLNQCQLQLAKVKQNWGKGGQNSIKRAIALSRC